MACPPPEFDWSSWATWSCLREDIAPIATFIGAAIVAWAALAQARTARRRHEEQTKADLERRITESFAKAVEQLGSDKLATRLGAIYTLEDISRESERKYWPIMETLTAYVRERAPWLPPQSDGAADQQKEKERELLEEIRPKTDVQAVLTVLGHRKEGMRKQERDDQRLDLSATDLRGATLWKADLAGANLSGANLKDANLRGTNLKDASLAKAKLARASLQGAILKGAFLSGVNLDGANLMGANLEDAWLVDLSFGVSFFTGPNLKHAQRLAQQQIDSTFGDENTILPEGLERPAHWPQPPEPPA